MGKLLNIQSQTIVFGTVTDLLNGAFTSLSGPIGFTPTQPRIIVKRVQVTNVGEEASVAFALAKGASGESASGTQVLTGSVNRFQTLDFELGLVLDSTDFLTGTCRSNTDTGGLIVNVTAEIEF